MSQKLTIYLTWRDLILRIKSRDSSLLDDLAPNPPVLGLSPKPPLEPPLSPPPNPPLDEPRSPNPPREPPPPYPLLDPPPPKPRPPPEGLPSVSGLISSPKSIESPIFPSGETSVTLTFTSCPSDTTSSGLLAYPGAICETCTNPSFPGKILTKAPKAANLTTLPVNSSPTVTSLN